MATEVSETKVDLVAKEIELTQLLASNDPKTRSDGIKQIEQLLQENSEDTSDAFQLNDYLVIWRGLFYFTWTSDKPEPQVSKGKVPTEALVIILDSFLRYISELNDFMLIREVTQNVFRNLLSPSPDLETLEAKFQASQKVINPGNSNKDLELVEGDIVNDNSNEINENPLDHQAGNVCVEIPRIKFNPKEVAKILNKYLTEVDCTRKCLWEITKLIQFYNRLGDCILPNRPTDLKLNSQVLKHKQKKYLSKMVKDGVKRLEMVDSRIKNSGLEVNDHKSLKELNKMGEIVVERGKMGKSMWKVRHFDNFNTLKENFNLNGSWTISKETISDGTNTVCINDDKPQILVPPGFNVEVSIFRQKIPTKVQNKVSLTPNFKCLTFNSSLKESNSNKHKSRNYNEVSTSKKIKNSKEAAKSVQSVNASPFNKTIFTQDNKIEEKNQIEDDPLLLAPAGYNVEVSETPENILTKIQKKDSLNPNFKIVTVDSSLKENHEVSASKEIKNSKEAAKSVQSVNASPFNKTIFTQDNKIEEKSEIKDDLPLLAPAGYNIEVSETPEKIHTKLRKKDSLNPNFKFVTVDSSLKESNSNKRKSKSNITQINDESKKKYIKKQNSCFIQIDTPNSSNATSKNSLSLYADHEVSASKEIKNSKEAAKSVQSVNASPFNKTIFIQDNKIEEKSEIKDDLPLLAPAGYKIEVSETPEKIHTKLQKKDSLNPNFKFVTVDSSLKESNSNKRKSKSRIIQMNDGSKKKNIKKRNSLFIKIGTPNALNTSCKNSFSISADDGGSVSKNCKNSLESAKAVQLVNISPFIFKSLTPDNKIRVGNKIDNEPSLQVPAEFNVEVSENLEKILTKLQKKVSLNPNFKFVSVDSTLKALTKMGKIVVKGGKIKKSMWKVRKSDKVNTLKDNFNLNGSWTVSKDTKINGTNTVCINDDKPPILVPPGFNVEVLETPEKTPTKLNKKISLTPSLTYPSVDSTLKALTKTGKIVVKDGKIKKSMWKVRKSDKVNTLKENFNLNGSWKVSKETIINGTNTVCINGDKPPILVPVGFNVEVLETPEKTLTKLHKKVSLSPSLTCPSVDSSIKEFNKMGEIVVERRKVGKTMWKVRHFDNVNTLKENFNVNGSWKVSKETISDGTNTVCINDDKPQILVPPGFNVEVLETPEKTPTKVQNKVALTPSLTPLTVDSSNEPNDKNIQKPNFPFGKIYSPNIVNTSHNNSCYLSTDNDGSASNKVKESNPSSKVEKGISLTSKITPDMSSKRLKSPTVEKRVLRRTTTIFSKNKQDGQNEDTPKSKMKETSATRVLRKCRKTIAGEEISMLKPEDISNKALEKVQSEALEDGSGSLRKSPRLSIKTTKELQKCRKTTAEEEISMLKPEEISNKALVKVQSEALEDGFGSLRKSPRLSIKTTKELQKCRKTTAGDRKTTAGKEISILKSEEISNKALEKVQCEALEDAFGSLRKSPRLSIKTTKELQKCRKTTAEEEISVLKPVEISNKALEKVQSEALEDGSGSLRKSPRLSIKTTKELQKCRKTTAGEEISMLKPEEISNKALVKVQSEALEDGFGSLRKSLRLSIKTTKELQKCRKTTAEEEISVLKPVEISNKALEKVQSEALEDGSGSLRKSPRLSIKTAKELQKCRKTTAGEEISMLKPEEISNKALVKVQSEALEDGFGSLRKSPRLSIKTTKELQKCRKTTAEEEISVLKPVEISNKALEKVQSEALEDGSGSLRKSPRLSIKTAKELQKCRKTTAGEEISMLKPEEISNKALEKVQSEAFEDSFGSLRKSPRLSIKNDSAKKMVEY
eukprot:XP_008183233.1 PREDICTED: uncharacterized protein LOC100574151 [Acyrthosiphon pisum]